jgi:hypothetical protein
MHIQLILAGILSAFLNCRLKNLSPFTQSKDASDACTHIHYTCANTHVRTSHALTKNTHTRANTKTYTRKHKQARKHKHAHLHTHSHSNFYRTFGVVTCRYYHPSNARVWFSGDDEPLQRLRMLNEYFSQFEYKEVHLRVCDGMVLRGRKTGKDRVRV